MGFFDKIFGSSSGGQQSSVEDVMTALEDEELDVLATPADFYVKPLSLETEGDLTVVEGELKARNVVLLNISPMTRNQDALKASLSKLSGISLSLGGDIARISDDKVLITPQGMQIVKSGKKH